MQQSNFIAAAILIAFFVYVTAKGSLGNYIALLTGNAGFTPDTVGVKDVVLPPDETDAEGDENSAGNSSNETGGKDQNETKGSPNSGGSLGSFDGKGFINKALSEIGGDASKSLGDFVGGVTGGSFGGMVGGMVGDKISGSLGGFGGSIGKSIGDAVGKAVNDATGKGKK